MVIVGDESESRQCLTRAGMGVLKLMAQNSSSGEWRCVLSSLDAQRWS